MGKIKIDGSIISRATKGDKEAIMAMFQTFVSEDEKIVAVEYLGKYGIIFPTKSFICVTDKKVASMQYGPFGKIVYSDAFIEEVNSGIIYQPSVLWLYIIGVGLCISIVGIVFLNAWVKLYYSVNKSGMVWCVREGVNIYAFSNRSKINLVNEIWRITSYLRGKRKQIMK